MNHFPAYNMWGCGCKGWCGVAQQAESGTQCVSMWESFGGVSEMHQRSVEFNMQGHTLTEVTRVTSMGLPDLGLKSVTEV